MILFDARGRDGDMGGVVEVRTVGGGCGIVAKREVRPTGLRVVSRSKVDPGSWRVEQVSCHYITDCTWDLLDGELAIF